MKKHIENENKPAGLRLVLNALVDQAPYIALLTMLAICIGGFVFVLRRMDRCWSAVELMFLLSLAKIIPVKWISSRRRRATGSKNGTPDG